MWRRTSFKPAHRCVRGGTRERQRPDMLHVPQASVQVNTTRLLRRIAKYLAENSGGKKQSGETAFGLASCGDAQVIRRIRNGASIGEELYGNVDRFLSERGF
jgi:hypothetical protein